HRATEADSSGQGVPGNRNPHFSRSFRPRRAASARRLVAPAVRLAMEQSRASGHLLRWQRSEDDAMTRFLPIALAGAAALAACGQPAANSIGNDFDRATNAVAQDA